MVNSIINFFRMIKARFIDKIRYAITDGYPDIFWPWIMECITIAIITISGTTLIYNYLKYKGIL